MALAKMDMKDVGKFWKKFRKLDKEMRGNIDIGELSASVCRCSFRFCVEDGCLKVDNATLRFGKVVSKLLFFERFACRHELCDLVAFKEDLETISLPHCYCCL